MKKKKIAIVIAVLSALSVAAACVLIAAQFKSKADKLNELNRASGIEDIQKLCDENEKTAFEFLEKDRHPLPDDMRGYFIDPEVDMQISGSADEVKKSAEAVFGKVDAIKPNTVVIKMSPKEKNTAGGVNYVQYLTEYAQAKDMTVIYSVNAEELVSASFKAEEKTAKNITESYTPDGILLRSASGSAENISSAAAELKELFGDVKVGVSFEGAANETEKALFEKGTVDFIFAEINVSADSGAENMIKSHSTLAAASNTKLYGILRNDLVKTGNGWERQDEMQTQLKLIYNFGGFSGCVLSSRKMLSVDDNRTATNLYFYYEYFNNSDYTSLTLKSFDISSSDTLTITGTSDSEYPLFVYSTAEGQYKQIDNSGEKGAFEAKYTLIGGENKICIKHKNALYTYCIDKVETVIKDCNTVIEDGTAKITVTANSEAEVYASLANVVPLKLEKTGEDGEFALFTAEYKLEGGMNYLTAEHISYGAVWNGIRDIRLCGENSTVTPYRDNGLGRDNYCLVEKDYSETTSAADANDSSDPTCTPQLAGSYAKVEKFSLSDNHVSFSLNNGMKVYSADSRLILNGFKLPPNTVTLKNVKTADKTTLTLSQTYPGFVKFSLSPQEYFVGFLQRKYNVKAFSAEYVDVIFQDADSCSVSGTPDFGKSDVIEKTEWYENKDGQFITLRLYLKEKGVFGGYSFERNENGDISISLKTKRKALDGTVVMLDPGHGGFGSPGTSYKEQFYEREITLAIAEKVKSLLEEHGVKVLMTREEDSAVFVEQRLGMLRAEKPDMFVSIHCDGSDSESLVGTHSFYYRSYSMPLASAIHEQLVSAYRKFLFTDTESKQYKDVDKGCKFFPYYVTRAEECPSVLIETGYLTNEQNAAFLRSEEGQQVIATAIAQGIVDYTVKN